ncbi:MAG: Eco57I restriction-modification methylase domain-containing protein, partial [Burkholderiales bacterium]
MTEFLVRRALQPLVAGRTSEQILNLRVVDPAMGSGAFLVAACRYLAMAAEHALVVEGEWRGDEDTRARRAALRRVVAQRCLYGVDLNPMAVQLARLSLWLTTLAGDRPLTFLDHHLAAGDSLVGAGLGDLARHPPRARRSAARNRALLPLFAADTADQMAAHILPERFRLALEPGDTAAAVRDKERALAALTAPGTTLGRWKTAADLWCGGVFWPDDGLSPGMYADVLAALLDRHAALAERQRSQLVEAATSLAREHRFFHWELEFPEVFFDAHGRRALDRGFDAVIGNPPWDALRADTGDRAQRDRTRVTQHVRLRFFRDAGLYR